MVKLEQNHLSANNFQVTVTVAAAAAAAATAAAASSPVQRWLRFIVIYFLWIRPQNIFIHVLVVNFKKFCLVAKNFMIYSRGCCRRRCRRCCRRHRRRRRLCILSSSEVIKLKLNKPLRFVVIYFLWIWPQNVFVLVVNLKKFCLVA